MKGERIEVEEVRLRGGAVADVLYRRCRRGMTVDQYGSDTGIYVPTTRNQDSHDRMSRGACHWPRRTVRHPGTVDLLRSGKRSGTMIMRWCRRPAGARAEERAGSGMWS